MTVKPPIDFARYPLEDAATMAGIIADCRELLERDQYCSLPGFLTPEAINSSAALVQSLKDQANPANSRRNCYLHQQGDPSLPDTHPRNIMNPARYRMLAADL